MLCRGGGEEAEIAGVYVVGQNGSPYRIGMAVGNEFSDHQFERKNYLNLAGSKLRTCALGPELVFDPEFESIPSRRRSSGTGMCTGRRRSAPGNRRCATACRTSSTIISSLKATAGRGTCTFTSLARTVSVSAITSVCKMGTSCRWRRRVTGGLCGTPST
jgi:hypothetical protein